MTAESRAALLARAIAALRDAGVPGPERDARLLLREASGLSAARFSTELAAPPGPEEHERFSAYLAARLARQPVSQILGRRAFWGRDFRVTPDVLDPRPETETLIEIALEGPPRHRVLDLGTGSGILLVTLLAEWPEARGLGVDASLPALEIARENAARAGVCDRSLLQHGNWLDGITGEFDCVVANPPYISQSAMAGLAPELRDWEPDMALTPGGDGLDAYRQIATGLARILTPRGIALFEIGFDQGESVPEIFRNAGFCEVSLRHDMNGQPRVVIVQG
ncbi:peptide chain release factor N(5)-glutamine methyltransferase [Paroceanicella profunda]|uniref:Release factor glutamine methyltransferase n=1 Tax=Paroceanicella profunda TaxID=2579971 RepID=A0A5B8G0C2_9RHOB|nr:peptide chain release factor N(5)-glutamine methyltransferase [Paroceanicella profunda]QDL92499.1 peptide chain release factor N(5)-glutamine methyltransferase [Paroceanicella profunda]